MFSCKLCSLVTRKSFNITLKKTIFLAEWKLKSKEVGVISKGKHWMEGRKDLSFSLLYLQLTVQDQFCYCS